MKNNKKTGKLILILICSLLLSMFFSTCLYAEETDEDEYVNEMSKARQIIYGKSALKYGMTPVYGNDVADGTYSVTAGSNSTYFKITEAVLNVSGGKMTAEITIPSMSYLYVFMGTSNEAGKAPESEWIGFKEVNGQTVFSIPVEALNKEIDCAAYSKARKKWYNRKIVFDAASLPEGTVLVDIPDFELIEDALKLYINEYRNGDGKKLSELKESEDNEDSEENPGVGEWIQGTPVPCEMDLEDGEYSIEVNMVGGSGRASVSSPTLLTVRDGKAYATLLWSSTYYDYMKIGDSTFYNMTKDGGNSTFEIPIVILDEGMPVIADTTAMGDPVEIRYELTFYSMTVGPKGNIPQEAAKKVLIIAAIIIVAGGILNYIIKKKRKA